MSFAPNVKCLAYHGPLLYEAKVLKVYNPKTKKISTKDGDKLPNNVAVPQLLQSQYGYFIHYKGWKATWDEWVGKDRILELTQENIQLQKQLKDTILSSLKETNKPHAKQATTERRANDVSTANSQSDSHPDSNDQKSQPPRRKRGHEETEKPDEFFKKPEIHLSLPAPLKSILVNDWEYVTKNHQLVSLPRDPNIIDLIDEFKEYYIDSQPDGLSSTEKDVLEEVLSGLRIYFDNALGHILLYRFERQQYKDIIHSKQYQDLTPSEIYGAEHLLRLFTCFPGLIAQTNMDQQSIGILKAHLELFIQFLHINQEKVFLAHYENTSPAYDSLSRT